MNSLNKTWLQYEAGKDCKRRIGLYSTVRENERFYRGDQWYGIAQGNLPKPVFNIVRRVVDYLVCSVTPERVSFAYRDCRAPFLSGEEAEKSNRLASLLGANASYRWEHTGMSSKLFKAVSDAALTGDGVLYCYWKSDEDGDGKYCGDIATDVIENVNVFVSDMNVADIQSQEYVILSGRASVASLRREARENGVDEKSVARITADGALSLEEAGETGIHELEGSDEEKTTYLIKFWREDGRVCFEKSTRYCVISRAKTPCKLYPIAYFNWYPTKRSFHGTSVASGMIANQKYVNRSYAMVMKHLSDTAFSKIVYDKTKIPEWTNEVGEAIAVTGAVNVSDAFAVLDTGKLQEDYIGFLQNVISTTKELGGATETALGNVTPNNTSAILAIQEASRIPLKLVRRAVYQCIEDLANIWADIVLAYYAPDRLVPLTQSDGKTASAEIGQSGCGTPNLHASISAIDPSTYSPSVTVSILDKLLDGGHISAQEYLEQIPSEYIADVTLAQKGARKEV